MERLNYIHRIEKAFKTHPIVALLGPRQCGKTTLARQYATQIKAKEIFFFDMEDTADIISLQNPQLALNNLHGLIIIDEIQLRPELFPALRVLIDKNKDFQRYLILGSASPELIRQTSQTLAGRIAYIELTPFILNEVGHMPDLWLKGGFPLSYLAKTEEDSMFWRKQYIKTFLERDIPNLGIHIPPLALNRFWSMLAHYHGNILNYSELSRAFGCADTTIRRYLDILSGTFMIRQLQPWFANISKRQVKAPKIYFRDSGLLHAFLDIETQRDLQRHPKLGASWEGFALEQILQFHQTDNDHCYFWATHSGAELDLFIVKGQQRLGFEFKYSDAPTLSKSMHIAIQDLELTQLTVIYPGTKTYLLAENIKVISLQEYCNQTTQKLIF